MSEELKIKLVEALEELRDRLVYHSTREKQKGFDGSGTHFAIKAREVERLIREVRNAPCATL